MSGKNVIVTGGYAGIGRETCRVFALAGAHVFLAGRDVPKANAVVEELKKETGNNNITPLELDLGSFASVRSSAEKFNKLNIPLHYLILNAGVMGTPYGKTKDGFETQFGTNVLGHFLFTNLLVPRLIEGAPSRVVSVSSAGHALGQINWEDVNFEKTPYNTWVAYGQSKTGNILFANELNRRYHDKGITANSLHPGNIGDTNLARHINVTELPQIMAGLQGVQDVMRYNLQPKTIPQGAATSLFAALSPDAARGGKFFFDCHEAEPMPYASDPENGKKLWDLAAKLVAL